MNTTSQTSAARSGTAQTIAIVTAVVGGVVLVGAGASSAFGALMPDPLTTVLGGEELTENVLGLESGGGENAALQTAAVDGITAIEVDAEAASFTVKFADVEEAELDVQYAAVGARGGDWVLRSDEEELVVERTGGSWIGVGRGGDRVTLTLPNSLSESGRLTGDLSLSGGELRAEGVFSQLDVDVDAGFLKFDGDAGLLDLSLSAGRADMRVGDARSASIDTDAGQANVQLTGRTPSRVEISAEVGKVNMKLPEAEYRVEARTELGAFDNQLTVDDASPYLVRVDAELADVSLR